MVEQNLVLDIQAVEREVEVNLFAAQLGAELVAVGLFGFESLVEAEEAEGLVDVGQAKTPGVAEVGGRIAAKAPDDARLGAPEVVVAIGRLESVAVYQVLAAHLGRVVTQAGRQRHLLPDLEFVLHVAGVDAPLGLLVAEEGIPACPCRY